VPNELKQFEAVVFAPPRAGAEAQARQLARSQVETIAAVSCDPQSFARDAEILSSSGYISEGDGNGPVQMVEPRLDRRAFHALICGKQVTA